MPKRAKKPASAEVQALKAIMVARDLKVADLASSTGFSARRITNCLCEADVTWPIREAINLAIGTNVFQPRETSNRSSVST